MMKKLYLIITLCGFFCLNISAQSHQWQWARTAIQPDNGSSHAWTRAVATDGQGNAFVTGYFYADSITFGGYTLHNTDPGGNSGGMYTVKYDPTGNVLWAQTAEGTGYNFPLAICTDLAGNVYIAGNYASDSVSFGGHIVYKYNPDSTTDMFVAKYSPTGSFLWAESYGGDYYDGINGVATDVSGNVYLAAYTESDSILIGSVMYDNPNGTLDHVALLIKLDSSGNFIWLQNSVCSNGGVEPYCVTVDPAGGIVMSGRVGGSSASFGSQVVQNNLTGYQDVFVVKYDSAGTALWAQDAGGSLDDEALGIAADAQRNVYVTGYFNSTTAYFGSGQVNNDTTDGTGDVFLAKYDAYGNLKWVQAVGGDQTDVGNSVAVDTSGYVYITGYYLSPEMIFGNDTIYNSDNSGNTDDIFLGSFDANGNALPSVSIGGLSYDVGSGVTADQSGNIYLTGLFRSDDIVFGSTTLDNCTFNHSYNPFLAKYESIATGINGLAQQMNMKLYPNPANDQIVAESSSFSSPGVTAAVYDVAGNIMPVGQTISNDKIIFNTGDLAAGMYLMKITAAGMETNAKFIKVNGGE